MHPTPAALKLNLAWEFNQVLPGVLERNRLELTGVAFPIIGPLPTSGRQTTALENALASPPFLYVAYSASGEIKYVGKGTDKTLKSVLQRWIRPNKKDGRHYWTHGTNSKTKLATVTAIAEEIKKGFTPVRLYFSNYKTLFPSVTQRAQILGLNTNLLASLAHEDFIRELERFLIYTLQPDWNDQDKKQRPQTLVAKCGDYWKVN
jgi:hypothetical protein